MGLFTKKIGPVFLKETSDIDAYIENLQTLSEKVSGDGAKLIEQKLICARTGRSGENKIAYELKNSGMDMYILHDIYLEYNDTSAQIDYIVITRQHTYIIECKMLSGNITIDSTGSFIRNYKLSSGELKQEGIYSPVRQNSIHLQVLKDVWMNNKSNYFTRNAFEKNFENNFQSVIVLANPKTCLFMDRAPKDVKDQVIRADQLITYIRTKDSDSKNNRSNAHMLEEAQFYLNRHTSGKYDYAQKYAELAFNMKTGSDPAPENRNGNTYVSKELLQKSLKAFRLKQSRAEEIKPYLIFNDAQMEDLLLKMPQTQGDLLKVSGFGDAKVNKYGEEILKILWSPVSSAE